MFDRRDLLKATALAGLSMIAGDASSAAQTPGEPQSGSARHLGFRMPLEAEPHTRTFMQWPSRAAVHGGRKALEAVRTRIVLIASTVARFEPLVMLAPPDLAADVQTRIGARIEVWPTETDDLWCRDSGPTFVRSADGALAMSELNFNGWGDKQPHANDRRIARRVAERLGVRMFDNGVVGEGGGIETDGAGTLLAHESSWVIANRNRRTKAEIERLLLDALGAERMIWAPGVRGADITDFHIDALARFIKPGQVLVQLPNKKNSSDPWNASAFETYEVLKRARDASGRQLDIVVMPEPNPNRIRSAAADFVSSYANYYVCNGAVIGAEFGDDKADATAKELLQQLYPGREVISLDIDPIGEAGGGIHCATQQQPVGTV